MERKTPINKLNIPLTQHMPQDECVRGEVNAIPSVDISLCESKVAQSCPTLCDPMDYSLPGSSLRGIFQARILEWVAISFSRRSSQPRD